MLEPFVAGFSVCWPMQAAHTATNNPHRRTQFLQKRINKVFLSCFGLMSQPSRCPRLTSFREREFRRRKSAYLLVTLIAYAGRHRLRLEAAFAALNPVKFPIGFNRPNRDGQTDQIRMGGRFQID
jgi:hypothetical protein